MQSLCDQNCERCAQAGALDTGKAESILRTSRLSDTAMVKELHKEIRLTVLLSTDSRRYQSRSLCDLVQSIREDMQVRQEG